VGSGLKEEYNVRKMGSGLKEEYNVRKMEEYNYNYNGVKSLFLTNSKI
jgi:hypothetical protein